MVQTPAQMVTTNEISKTATRVSKTTTTAGPDDIFSPVSNKDIEDWKSSKKLVAEQNKIAQAKAEVNTPAIVSIESGVLFIAAHATAPIPWIQSGNSSG